MELRPRIMSPENVERSRTLEPTDVRSNCCCSKALWGNKDGNREQTRRSKSLFPPPAFHSPSSAPYGQDL